MSAATIDYDALAAQHGGTAAVDYDALAAQHGGTAVDTSAPDTRNGVQKYVDNLTTVTPEQEKGHSWLTNKAQEFGAGAIQGFTAPIVHPLDTLENLGSMVAHPIRSAVAMGKSAVANPAQFAGNLVGGAVMGDAAGEVAGPALQVAKRGAGRAALLGKTPQAAYESALKPSTALSAADRAGIVNTALDNAIPVSKGGVEKLGDLIDDLNRKIYDTIDADPTRPIDPNAVAARANQVRPRFANQVNAGGDLADIEAAKQQFLREQGAPADQAGNVVGPAPDMYAGKAQAMKQGTYTVLKGKFGEQGSASVEAQKALARGLKEEIATQFPEISKLNADESRLLDLQPVLERAVNRISNHQSVGIGTPIAGTAIRATTGSTSAGAVAMMLKAVLDNPAVKSRLAIAVSKAQKIPFSQASSRVQAYSSALGAASGATEGYASNDTPSQ